MPKRPRIFAFFGLIASGKSTLAAAWAEQTNLAYYNSDVVRKELAGLAGSDRQQESFAAGIYTPEFSRKTYDALLALAEVELRAGRSVVLDASYQNSHERLLVNELAAKNDGESVFIHCLCPEDETKRRLDRRALDPQAVSDGSWEIYLKQRQKFSDPVELKASELVTINTNMPLDDLLSELTALLASQQ